MYKFYSLIKAIEVKVSRVSVLVYCSASLRFTEIEANSTTSKPQIRLQFPTLPRDRPTVEADSLPLGDVAFDVSSAEKSSCPDHRMSV